MQFRWRSQRGECEVWEGPVQSGCRQHSRHGTALPKAAQRWLRAPFTLRAWRCEQVTPAGEGCGNSHLLAQGGGLPGKRCRDIATSALERCCCSVVPVALEPGFGKMGCSASPSPLLSLP